MEKKKPRIVTVEMYVDDEIIQREVKKFGGNAGHIILPSKHVGKKALIFLTKSHNLNRS